MQPERGGDHPPHLSPRLEKEYSYTSTPALGLRCLLQGELYLASYHTPILPNSVDVTSCSLIGGCQRFEVTFFLHV